MKQTKKQTWFRTTSRSLSLALVSLFLLGSFLLSMFVVPTSVSAQGQGCLQQDEGKCGSLAGCPSNQICMQVGWGSECQYEAGKCGYNMFCGTIGNPANGDTCGCGGSQFAQMGTGNYCCGYIANGICVATFPANCGSELNITGKEGVGITLPESTRSHRVYATYQFKNQDFDSYFLSIATTGSTGVESFSTTAVNPREVNAYTRSVSFNLTDRKFFQALPPEAGATKIYSVGLYGSRGGTHSLMCTLGEYEISSDEENPNPQTCTRSNWGKCGAAGGCLKNTETCVEGGCREVDRSCEYSAPAAPPTDPDATGDPADADAEASPPEEGSLLDAIKGPTNKTFDALNPLNIAAGLKGEPSKSPYFRALSTPGGVISRLLLFAFPIAGMILFLMIVWGGFEMVTGATNAKSMDAGKQRITAAVIGFILLFVSYWLMQLIELIFGLSIL